MAPTKPLVAQQIEACHNIMGIPDATEMTGKFLPQGEAIETGGVHRVVIRYEILNLGLNNHVQHFLHANISVNMDYPTLNVSP